MRILSFGGFLGMGDKLFAVPWNALHYDPQQEAFVLHADKRLLENAPGFDKENWPDMSDTTWRSSVYNYYSAKPLLGVGPREGEFSKVLEHEFGHAAGSKPKAEVA